MNKEAEEADRTEMGRDASTLKARVRLVKRTGK